MSLYLKYRPPTFEDIYGNENVVTVLQNLLKNDPPHAYLLHGPTGCGKTTIGRIIAQELECTGMDLKEVDSADFRGIDTIRAIRHQAQYKSIESPVRVWIIDECHKLTNDAQNALLKILEDTPSHVYFILCTTDPQKLLKTIRGRCSEFQVNPLADSELLNLLREVVRAEGEVLHKRVYDQICQDSLGHPRNALQILEQVLSVEPDQRLETAKKTAEETSQSIELCRALIRDDKWGSIAKILSGLQEQDPESIRRHVLGYCKSVLLKEANDQAGLIMENFIRPFYDSGFSGVLLACYSVTKGEVV